MDLSKLLDATAVLSSFGYAALFGIVFAESGLFFGFFLPGDSLLFTAGLLASKGLFDIWLVFWGCALFAFLGDQVGYWCGELFGTGFFNKPGSWFRDPGHIRRAHDFYQKHGKKTIVFARFVPAVRTFAPIVAGAARMDYSTFVLYNAIGGVGWVGLFTALGYFLGSLIPNSIEYVSLAIIAIIAISFLPIIYEILKEDPKAPAKALKAAEKLAERLFGKANGKLGTEKNEMFSSTKAAEGKGDSPSHQK